MLYGEGVGGDGLRFSAPFIQNRSVESGLLCGRPWAGPEPVVSSGTSIPGSCPYDSAQGGRSPVGRSGEGKVSSRTWSLG